jgi:NAD(P)-dependent dehydrogenase (short-subunit alcohol dehydrogenase family)
VSPAGLLHDKVVVVSGIGPGLGQEIAMACARDGATVVMGARTETYLQKVAGQIAAAGGTAVAVPTDITKPGDCVRLVAAAVDGFGRVDALVNNAFKADVFQPFESVDLDEWRSITEVNVFGTLQLCQAVVPAMKAQASGSIVFVNSMIMRKPLPLQGGYATSKGGLMTAAHLLSRELGPYGIRVNSVVPGWMWGPPVEGYVTFMAQQNGTSVDDEIAVLTRDIPLGIIPPDEAVADAVVFFASDLSSAVSGQSLDANGGEVFA